MEAPCVLLPGLSHNRISPFVPVSFWWRSESIDHLTIPSKEGRGDLRRVPEVFDCWFESGSMPYAQVHYPFNKEVCGRRDTAHTQGAVAVV